MRTRITAFRMRAAGVVRGALAGAGTLGVGRLAAATLLRLALHRTRRVLRDAQGLRRRVAGDLLLADLALDQALHVEQQAGLFRADERHGKAAGTVAAGAASNQMQFPGLPFCTVFRPNDTLSFDVQNTSLAANSWALAFHGVWLLG